MTHPHTTSLEQSKKLAAACREKGVEMPESYFWWQTRHIYLFTKEDGKPFKADQIIPAYNLSELMRMLPATVDDGTWLSFTKSENGWKGVCQNIAYVKWEEHEGMGQLMIKEVIEKSIPAHYPNEKPSLSIENAACELLTELILSGKVTELSV